MPMANWGRTCALKSWAGLLLGFLCGSPQASDVSLQPPPPPKPSLGSQVSAVANGPSNLSASTGALSPATQLTLEGTNFAQDATNAGFYHIPPDPHGAAGPNHLVTVVNTTLEWYDKTGASKTSIRLGKNASTVSGSFFSTQNPANGLFDPKVIYDQQAGRFLVVALEKVGPSTNTSRILLAVSQTSDPNGTWYFTAINSKINIGGSDSWADYPGFATDEEAVYVTANMFKLSDDTPTGSRLWVINKSPFYTGGAAGVNVYDPGTLSSISPGYPTAMQPAMVFGASGAGTGVGTYLVHTGYTSGSNELLGIIRVDNPLGGIAFSNQFINLGDVSSGAPPDAPQSGTATLVSTNDNRALNAVWRNNKLYSVNTVNPPSGVDLNQATAHYYVVDTTNPLSLTLLDQGNIGGEEIATGTHTFMPSIAVDKFGNFAIGFSASASSIFPGAYYTVKSPSGTIQPAGTVATGVNYYIRKFGGTENRWGDYSGTVVDPSDDLTFWVFNEYAMAQTTGNLGNTGETGDWGTRWAKFQVAKFKSDFSGDRKDDILFRHSSSGDVYLWIMN